MFVLRRFLCGFNATGRRDWSGNFSWYINDLNATGLSGVNIQVIFFKLT
jgi:hypothetical protein